MGNENKCDQNISLIKEAVELCDEGARMLGYPNHATFVLEDKMSKTPQTVQEFLDELRRKLINGAQKEIQKLKKLKHADTGDSDHYYLWDHSYYNAMVLSRDFQLDENAVAEYFPLRTCMEGMLRIFEELFGLVFIKVEGNDRDVISETGRGDDIVWHPDVELFSVWDSDDGQQDGLSFIGICTLIFSRGMASSAAQPISHYSQAFLQEKASAGTLQLRWFVTLPGRLPRSQLYSSTMK